MTDQYNEMMFPKKGTYAKCKCEVRFLHCETAQRIYILCTGMDRGGGRGHESYDRVVQIKKKDTLILK